MDREAGENVGEEWEREARSRLGVGRVFSWAWNATRSMLMSG